VAVAMWGSYLKGASDFLANASAQDVLERARQAAQAAQEAASKVSETVQEEYRKTFVDLDCHIFAARPELQVMEFPSDEKIERLSVRLNQDFAQRMMILNMSERKYDTSKFRGEVVEVAFRGLPSPPLELLLELCLSSHHWLASDASNVLVVHCFQGYSRSAIFLSCFMAFRGFCATPVDALHQVCKAVNISDKKDIVPSQRRYLAYFQQVGRYICSAIVEQMKVQQGIFPTCGRLRLLRAQLNGVPRFESEGNVAFRPYIEIWNAGMMVYSSLPDGSMPTTTFSANDSCASFQFPEGTVVSGDVLIRMRHVYQDGTKVTALRLAFHTGFVMDGFQLAKRELDSACGDSRFSDESFLDLVFERLPAAGEKEDSVELEEALPQVYGKARDLSRKLAEEERKRQEADAATAAANGRVSDVDEFAELEAALRGPGSSGGSSGSSSGAAAAAGDGEDFVKALEVATGGSEEANAKAAGSSGGGAATSSTAAAAPPPPAAAAGPSAAIPNGAAAAASPAPKAPAVAAASAPAAAAAAKAGAAAPKPAGSTEMDDLFDEFDAALASFGGDAGTSTPAAAVAPASDFNPPPREAAAAAAPVALAASAAAKTAAPALAKPAAKPAAKAGEKKDADDVFGDVDAFLAELDA